MPDTQASGTTGAAPRNGGAGDPAQYNKRTPAAGAAETEQASRAAEDAVERTAEAGQEALRAGQEILRTNVETAQDTMRAAMEAGVRAFEAVTANMSRTFAVTTDGRAAQQSAQNFQAVSQAGTALAHAAQEASRAWLDLVQQTARTNLEAVSRFADCRTVQDVFAVQSALARENFQRVIDSGDKIARSTTRAMEEASKAMQQGESAGR